MSSTFDIETGILCWLCRRLRLIERPECMVRRFAASKSGVTAWSAHEPPLILATRKVRQRIPSNRSIVQRWDDLFPPSCPQKLTVNAFEIIEVTIERPGP